MKPLDNLVKTGQLKREPAASDEVAGLVRSGARRLLDAENPSLSLESRFDLAYNAAHSLGLAGLRVRGYRAENRYVVFQALPHTLGVPAETWRILDDAHRARNRAEYEGVTDVPASLVDAVIRAAKDVHERVRAVLEESGAPR